MKLNEQMEITFDGSAPVRRQSRRRRTRLERARWWFRQMHEVVQRAVSEPPLREPRPEQIHFRLARHDLRDVA